MGRTFDRQLTCGCALSSEGGGGVIPCCYPGYGASKAEMERCDKAWKEFKKSKDYELFKQECIDNNH